MNGFRRAVLAAFASALALALVFGCDQDALVEERIDAPLIEVELAENLIFDSVPVLRVGGGEEPRGGHAFHLAVGGLLLSSGGVVVATEGSQSLLYFDRHGDMVREKGMSGEGPGEYRRIHSLHRIGADTIAVFDRGLQRITILDPEGEVVTIVALGGTVTGGERAGIAMHLLAMGQSGFATISGGLGTPPPQRPDGFSKDDHLLAVLDRKGVPRSTHTVGGTEWYTRRGVALPSPLGHRLLAGGTDRGYFLVPGKAPELSWFDTEGAPVGLFRFPVRRSVASGADKEVFLGRVAESTRLDARELIIEITRTAISAVDSLPAFTQLVVGGEGCLWLRLGDFPWADARWLVFDPTDSLARPIFLPGDVALADALEDRVLLFLHDDMDREVFEVHRIVR